MRSGRPGPVLIDLPIDARPRGTNIRDTSPLIDQPNCRLKSGVPVDVLVEQVAEPTGPPA